MREPRRVLVVEDDEQFGRLITRTLNADGFSTLVHESPIGATNAARAFRPHIILVDLELPAYDGAQTVRVLRRAGIHARYFLWSSADPDRVSRAAIEVSADGWFSKSDIASLARSLKGVCT